MKKTTLILALVLVASSVFGQLYTSDTATLSRIMNQNFTIESKLVNGLDISTKMFHIINKESGLVFFSIRFPDSELLTIEDVDDLFESREYKESGAIKAYSVYFYDTETRELGYTMYITRDNVLESIQVNVGDTDYEFTDLTLVQTDNWRAMK